MPTNPPANPLPGAVYVDQTTNIAWVWTGTYWLQAYGGATSYNAQVTPTTSIIPGYYASPSPEEWLPVFSATTPGLPACGLIWVNTGVVPNTVSIWDCINSAWIPLGGAVATAGNVVIVATAQPTLRVDGTGLITGDLWVNPTTQVLAYYNGATFVPLTSPDTHSIFSAVAPATRIDGSLLQAGDMWTDPDDNKLYYFNGVGWIPVVATSELHQISNAIPTTRPSGDALVVADLWTDTDTQTLHYYDGVAWIPLGDLHSFTGAGAPTLAVRPSGANLVAGDQYYDVVTNDAYYWNGATWQQTTDRHSFVGPGVAALIQRPNGTPLVIGDMWVDSTTNQVYYWNGAAWNGVVDTHAFAAPGAPAGNTRPDGTPLLTGDMYINTLTNDAYYWDGVNWDPLSDSHSFTGLVDPALLTRPSGAALQVGDQYVNTVNNTLFYWDGANWDPLSDTHSFVDAGAPALATRPDGSALIIGDQYVDSLTNNLYYWNGAAWFPTSDTHSFVDGGPPVLATRPGGAALVIGDQYLDNLTNNLYYWNGAAWTPVSDTHSFVDGGPPVLATRPDGTALVTGDQYLDNLTNNLYYWDGAAWQPVSDHHAFLDAGVPLLATRPDGTPLQDGDQYIDLLTSILYYWDGAVWLPTTDLHSFVDVGAPVLALRPDGTPLQFGDQYVDQATNTLYYWNGGAWFPVSDHHSFIDAGPPVLALRPDGTTLQDGDQYINTVSSESYYWDGAAWVLFGVDTHCFTGVGHPIDDNLLNPFITRPNGTPLQTGDQYWDTTSNILYAYTGGAWVVISNDTHSFIGNASPLDAPAVVTRPDGTDLQNGDQFIDLSSNVAYVWNGLTWVPFGNDTHSFLAAGDPIVANPTLTRPNGTPLVAGDIYIDTTNGQGYYWDAAGNAWELFGSPDTHSFTGTGHPILDNVGNPFTQRPNGEALVTGDQYWDTLNNILYAWDGGNWVMISRPAQELILSTNDPTLADIATFGAEIGYVWRNTATGMAWQLEDTNLVAGGDPTWVPIALKPSVQLGNIGGAPTTQASGAPLMDGDILIDIATNAIYYYDDGPNTWTPLGDQHAIVDSVEPATRPDGSDLQDGDQLYLTTTTPWTLKYWNDALNVWVGELNQRLVVTNVDPVNGVDVAYQYGTVWVNSTDNDAFEYVAPQLWKPLIQEKDIQFLTGAAPIAAPTVQSDGLPLMAGDLYYDSNTGESYIYDLANTTWLPFGSDTHSFSSLAAPVLRPNGSPLKEGDTWNNLNQVPSQQYIWDGDSWEPTADVKVIATLPATGAYLNELYVQTSNNKMYRWSTGEGSGDVWIQVV